MMETRITRAFELTTPILSAGMAFVSRPELAAAVSNAGGMGFVAAEMTPPYEVAGLARATRRLTSRPFGMEFMTPYFTRWHLDGCVADPVAVVAFHWGMPERVWVERIQEAGSQVWVKAVSLAEARRAAREGADAVIVEAPEGGPRYAGSRLIKLLADVVDAVDIPVIASAAGVDGAGLCAALRLGAGAVRCGTLFLSAEEARAEAEYARSIADSPIDVTLRVNLLTREWPERPTPVLTRQAVSEWIRSQPEVTQRPVFPAFQGARSGNDAVTALARSRFFQEPGAAAAPSSGPGVVAIQPAARILEGIIADAQRIAEKREELCAVA